MPAMASFPLFSCFPVEIQLAVWAFAAFAAVLDPQPEVCLVWPLHMEPYATPPDQPVLPFVVDTAWPAVVHVCRAAREAVLNKSGAVQLRYSSLAGFAVPYRHFIPAIDTLYWGHFQAGAMRIFFARPENASLAQDLRHLSVELTGWYQLGLAELIRGKAVDLRTLSIVFPATINVPGSFQSFLPPARRCKLRNMSDKALDEITMARVPFLRLGEREPMPLRKYLDKQRGNLDSHVLRFYDHGPDGTAWSTRDKCFSGLEITAQTFVEYRGIVAEGNQEQWVETCQDRLVARPDDDTTAPRPRHIWPEDRKSPEEYRVLDDDSSQCSLEENRAYIQRKRGNQPHSSRVALTPRLHGHVPEVPR